MIPLLVLILLCLVFLAICVPVSIWLAQPIPRRRTVIEYRGRRMVV